MDSASELIRAVSIFAIPVLFAITLHEAAYGYAARHFGDNTGMTGPTLPHWVEKKYGLRMGQDGSGNYTQDYDVVDPKRFMLFQIKYFK